MIWNIRGQSQIEFKFSLRHVMLKIQTYHPTYLSVSDQEMLKINETVLPVEIVFSVDLAFMKFATCVLGRCMSQFLAWNVFL